MVPHVTLRFLPLSFQQMTSDESLHRAAPDSFGHDKLLSSSRCVPPRNTAADVNRRFYGKIQSLVIAARAPCEALFVAPCPITPNQFGEETQTTITPSWFKSRYSEEANKNSFRDNSLLRYTVFSRRAWPNLSWLRADKDGWWEGCRSSVVRRTTEVGLKKPLVVCVKSRRDANYLQHGQINIMKSQNAQGRRWIGNVAKIKCVYFSITQSFFSTYKQFIHYTSYMSLIFIYWCMHARKGSAMYSKEKGGSR